MNKFFATSDIHGSKEILNKLVDFIKTRQDIDEIMICGDLTGKYNVRSIEELNSLQRKDLLYLQDVIGKICPANCYYIFGNDDWVDFECDNTTDINYLPFTRLSAYLTYTSFPYIGFEYVNITPFNTNREVNENKIHYELSRMERKASAGIISNRSNITVDKNTIVVAHVPPYKTRDRCSNGQRVGSKSVREFIELKQPKIWLCGHIHEDFGLDIVGDTLVANCSCDHLSNTLRGWVIDRKTKDFEKIVI